VTVASATVVVQPGSVVVTVIYTVVASGLIGTIVMPAGAVVVVGLAGGTGRAEFFCDMADGMPLLGCSGGGCGYVGGDDETGLLVSAVEA
jgi:hypothetical protein